MEGKRGLTLLELLVVTTIISIFLSVAMSLITRYYRAYKYNEYVLQIESTIKWARLLARERGIAVGVCVQNNTLTLHNMLTRRSGLCNGEVIRRIEVNDDFVSIRASGGGSAFDSRGLAIFSSTIFVTRVDVEQCECFAIQPLRGYIKRGVCNGNRCL